MHNLLKVVVVGLALVFVVGCFSKHVATCMKFEEKGRAHLEFDGGPIIGVEFTGDITGPTTFERIPEDMTYNPCVTGMSQTHP